MLETISGDDGKKLTKTIDDFDDSNLDAAVNPAPNIFCRLFDVGTCDVAVST